MTSPNGRADLLAELHQQRLRRDARRLLEAEDRTPAALPEILTLRKRLARPLPPVAWRIRHWHPADARIILSAQFKAGKTTLVGNLVRSLIDGDPFLGHYEVTPIAGRLALLDFEMSARQLDEWLGAQRIRDDDRVVVVPLRGSATAFDLVDPATRSRWAELLRRYEASYVVWDCFRPVLDALGLDEHRDAGRLLVGYDALLKEAGISESVIVHHMGHTGERSRGDSRIRDWPDVEWRLVRQDDEPASPRFITAFGRDVDVPESQLAYDPVTRRLSVVGGSRKDAAATSALSDVLALLIEKPGLSGNKIETEMAETDHTQKAIRDAIKAGTRQRKIRTEPGPRNAVLHFVSSLDFVASSSTKSSEFVSSSIERRTQLRHGDDEVRQGLDLLVSEASEEPPGMVRSEAEHPLDLVPPAALSAAACPDHPGGAVYRIGRQALCREPGCGWRFPKIEIVA